MQVVPLLRRMSSVVVWLSAAAFVSLAGCTSIDAPTMPAAADAQFELHADGATRVFGVGSDTTITLVRIDPSSTDTYSLGGGHALWVRAHGVCELDAPYGPTFWDESCELRREPFVVAVKSWSDAAGHPQIEFSADVRFAAAAGPRGAAMLFLRDPAVAVADQPSILYCRDGGCVDESVDDPSLVTIVDAKEGYVYRRVKHLSGFVIAGGFAE